MDGIRPIRKSTPPIVGAQQCGRLPTSLDSVDLSCVYFACPRGCRCCPCYQVKSVTPPVETLIAFGGDQAMLSGAINPDYNAATIVLANNKATTLRHCVFHRLCSCSKRCDVVKASVAYVIGAGRPEGA